MTGVDGPDRKALPLFDDIPRAETRPARNAEPLFTYLNTTARPHFAEARKMLEGWFARLPEDDRPGLRGRFRKTKDRHHLGAFWELYVHEVFTRLGYRLEPHPDVPGTSNHPDFLVVADDVAFYLEATMAMGVEDLSPHQKRAHDLLDELNRLEIPNFVVRPHVEFVGPDTPRTKPLRRALERWTAGLDPDELWKQYQDDGEAALPSWSWTNAGWLVHFTAMPLRETLRGRPDIRPVGSHMVGGATLRRDDVEIRKSVEDKAGKYGALDLPHVVAVLGTSHFLDDLDVQEALFGSEEHLRDQLQEHPAASRHPRQLDGALLGPGGPRNQVISAVLVGDGLTPSNVTREEPTLWMNPLASSPIEADWPFPTFEFGREAGCFQLREPHRGIAELLRGEPCPA